jgi:nucleotide-binding universal stress UspA family protein
MFKNIMLPVDGSHFSELALPLAVRVAERSNARLHVVRVHTPPVATAESIVNADYEDLVRDWERDSLQVALERATASGIAATAHLIDGPIVHALQKYIEAAAIDLVVMSTHGRSGIKRAVLGSVAEQCVRKTEVPILLLRPRADDDVLPAHFVDWRRVVVPLDGTEQSEAVLPHAVDFARLTGAEIVLTRAALVPFEVSITIDPEGLKDYAARVHTEAAIYLRTVQQTLPSDIKVRYETITGDRASDAILKFAEKAGADLIAMATHGRSGWARIAVGSVAETVLHKSATPILLIKGITERTSEGPRSMQSEQAHFGG